MGAVGSSSGIDGAAQIGQNQAVGRKQDKQPEGLAGGQLSHNPFAALAGKPSASAEGSINLPGGGNSCVDGHGSQKDRSNKHRSQKQSGKAAARNSAGTTPGKLIVRFEAKGHGGKTVTRISGLEIDSEALKNMARDLKKAMGTGARVEEGDVLVQGKLVERVAEWLTKAGHGKVIRGN